MSPRKYTEARKQGNKKWDAQNLDRVSVAMPKGDKAIYQAHAATTEDGSLNKFINRAMRETMDRDKQKETGE